MQFNIQIKLLCGFQLLVPLMALNGMPVQWKPWLTACWGVVRKTLRCDVLLWHSNFKSVCSLYAPTHINISALLHIHVAACGPTFISSADACSAFIFIFLPWKESLTDISCLLIDCRWWRLLNVSICFCPLCLPLKNIQSASQRMLNLLIASRSCWLCCCFNCLFWQENSFWLWDLTWFSC